MATSLSFGLSYIPVSARDATPDLFELIEQRFGASCARLKIKRNALICGQGAKLTCLYLIQEGEIVLTRESTDGREILLSILGPGEFFGEGALLMGSTIAFSAKATRQSTLMQLPERKFKLLLEEPETCRMLLEAVARRCDDAWMQMEVLGCKHVRDKVRTGLLWLSGCIGVATHEGIRINLNQTQLARMVGCERETLSREVSELRRLGAIDVRSSNGRKAFFVRKASELGQQN
jgi:CRP/FNR family transcriptional regulator, cyclic AMP receptor protein